MAVPLNAVGWVQPMDPTDLIDYEMDFLAGDEPMLEVGEGVTDYTLTLSPEAVTVGLEINEGGSYDHFLIDGNTAVRLWLSVVEEMREDDAFLGEGVTVGVIATIDTNSFPPRRRQRTWALKVAQQ